ncbi:hypothetical protein LYNGBM3L_14650 [Moorena producens 3L]|uniref:Uncharacterized protein n=1 Tax=Moorena producens 3L TaxID=489825 RepID=F4XLG6_9CYAN|nr:hypothetical protein LYNGBM3L_14650 [Moorena producens 3L]
MWLESNNMGVQLKDIAVRPKAGEPGLGGAHRPVFILDYMLKIGLILWINVGN